MDTLPPELIRYFIPFFPLTTLIAARGVNTKWRTLAQTASLHPARKVLLDLYLAVLVHPDFPSLVETLQPHLCEFDREAYLADLTARGCVLPDMFELWVLEWPSKAIHFWAWPGFPDYVDVEHKQYHDGGNMLCHTSPVIDTIPVPEEEAAPLGAIQTCRALGLWDVEFYMSVGVAQLWLVVDADGRVNNRQEGRLLWTYSRFSLGPDNVRVVGPKTVFRKPPIGDPSPNFVLIDFLDMLKCSYKDFDTTLERYYFTGFQ